MKRAENLFEAIGLVKDDYIEEAADAHVVRTSFQWQRWGTLAATLVLVTGLGLAATTQLRGCGSKSSSMESVDTAAPENGSVQESITADSASDSATGSGTSMENSAVTEGSAGSTMDSGMTEAPADAIGTELTVLTVSDGAWTVDRHTQVEADAVVTVTDAYTVTNDGDTVQEIEAQSVAPGETVELERVITDTGTEYVLLPVENVTPGTWTVEVVAADGYAVEGLSSGEVTWEPHAFTIIQP